MGFYIGHFLSKGVLGGGSFQLWITKQFLTKNYNEQSKVERIVCQPLENISFILKNEYNLVSNDQQRVKMWNFILDTFSQKVPKSLSLMERVSDLPPLAT